MKSVTQALLFLTYYIAVQFLGMNKGCFSFKSKMSNSID